MSMPSISKRPILVAPFAGAWIEIAREQPDKYFGSVAPFAGAWIEMRKRCSPRYQSRSLPSRERGLKCRRNGESARRIPSLPSRERGLKLHRQPVRSCLRIKSLPSRERGLKYREIIDTFNASYVAPFAGAWIEIASAGRCSGSYYCRSLRGSVD